MELILLFVLGDMPVLTFNRHLRTMKFRKPVFLLLFRCEKEPILSGPATRLSESAVA